MLGFLSFIIALAILSGTVGLIAATIRDASETIFAALRGNARHRDNFVNFGPRRVRQSVPMRLRSAPLRAAA
jgi:hypothetical protein